MPNLTASRDITTGGGLFIDAHGNVYVNTDGNHGTRYPLHSIWLCQSLYLVSVLDLLKPYCAFNAGYNSQERQDQQASICKQGIHKHVINQIVGWAEKDCTCSICWLYGPAGTGKSSIAHTIATHFIDKGWVALTFFFSCGRANHIAITKLFATLAYLLAVSKVLPAAQQAIGQAIQEDPSILTANFETQFHNLVVDPILASAQSLPKIIIIIDGLDECDSSPHQALLIKLLVKQTPALSSCARFLVTS